MSETQYAGSFTMTMASAASNIDFFRSTLSDDACANWRVTINNAVSEQKANNLTFSEGDVIKIEYDTNHCVFHPGEMDGDPSETLNYILNIEGSLPFNNGSETGLYIIESFFENCSKLVSASGLLFSNWTNVKSFSKCFQNCYKLSSISEDIFQYNINATSFPDVFNRCFALKTVPEKIFSNNINATVFNRCFQECTSLTSIPENIFVNNNKITSIRQCFYGCTSLTPLVYISSPNISSSSGVDNFAKDCAAKGTVYVLANSTTYTVFIESTTANVNVLTWNPDAIEVSDTPLVSMVLVDDENNRTTFNGPIINDFTITEDLQSKITQLTTLATNISNLQTRLTNITNILNTQNIEFTDNVSDVSSAGSKLYIQPQYYLKLVNDNAGSIRYINLTPYVTGKYNFTLNSVYTLSVTASLKLNTEFNFNEWKIQRNITTGQNLTVQSDGEVGDIDNITMQGTPIYIKDGTPNLVDQNLQSNSISIVIEKDNNLITPSDICTINITFTK